MFWLKVSLKGRLLTRLSGEQFSLMSRRGVPIRVVYLFHGASLSFSFFFRQISIIRWAETILQLNSLFNLLLYWYRNRRLKEVAVELLSSRNRPATCSSRHIKQRPYSVLSLDVKKLQSEQRGARLLRSESLGALML